MRCCVPDCKNDTRNISKSQGITFHVFPNEAARRMSWLRAIGKEKWVPKERSAICSEHFLSEDLYETKSGLRRVRIGAVPMVCQVPTINVCEDAENLKESTINVYEDVEDLKVPTINVYEDIENLQVSIINVYGDAENLQVCRICLTQDRKLISIYDYKLVEAYENVTGVLTQEETRLPRKLCTECAQRLINCSKFKSKSLRAHSLMLDLVKNNGHLTHQLLKTVNRPYNRLLSNLAIKTYSPDHYDLYVEHADVETSPKANGDTMVSSRDVIVNVEVKHETDEFVETVDPEPNNDLKVEDYVPSDREFSSDDSIPLVKQKKKIEKKTKKGPKVQKEILPKIDKRRKPFLNVDLNGTLFTITDLSFEEQIAEIEKRQESANYKNSLYKCTYCYKGFLDEDAYNGHVIRHTNKCGEYECEVCKTHFKNSHALRKHQTAHHTHRFSCNHCFYITTHRQTARLHERWHKGTKYLCPHCPDEFIKFTTYMGHIRIKHPSDFVCALCGYSFVSEKGIELHKKLKHRLENVEIPEDGPYCDTCNVRFVSTDALHQHIQVSARHTNDSQRNPREANKPKKQKKTIDSRDSADDKIRERRKRDSNETLYPSQMRRHEGPIPCEQCGMQLEDSRAYHGHFRRMHPDKNRTNYPSMKTPCMCEVCGKMFQSYALLKDHTWLHTGEKPFKCDACDKSFRMRQRLVAHRRVHLQSKATYVCAQCGKHFSTHSNRQRHMIIHTGLKPFKCEMCGKGFKHASEKRAHITYVHLKKPWPKRSRGKRRQPGLPTPQPLVPASASEMDIPQPLWPSCDPKLTDLTGIY